MSRGRVVAAKGGKPQTKKTRRHSSDSESEEESEEGSEESGSEEDEGGKRRGGKQDHPGRTTRGSTRQGGRRGDSNTAAATGAGSGGEADGDADAVIVSDGEEAGGQQQPGSEGVKVATAREGLRFVGPAKRAPPASQVERVLKFDDDKQQYLVKYQGMSYRDAGWLARDKLEGARIQLARNFLAKGEEINVEEEWLVVDRVVAGRSFKSRSRPGASLGLGGGGAVGLRWEFLVKWRGLEYSDATWEREEDLQGDQEHIARFQRIRPRTAADLEGAVPEGKRAACLKAGGPGHMTQLRDVQALQLPSFCNGRKLRSYQEEAVRWMVSNYVAGRNCILGDEMGLGKTAQSVSCLETLRQLGHVPGPFLLVAPLTTLGHWQREIQTWTDMNVVLYAGSRADRQVILEHEFKFDPDTLAAMAARAGASSRRAKLPSHVTSALAANPYRFNALLISYETLLKEQSMLCKIPFSAAVFDEAHKLKGATSSTRAAAMALRTGWTLLLTGTPIQNHLGELWAMLNFLDREEYPDQEAFMEQYMGPNGGPPSMDQVNALRGCLSGLLLRRMKEDVETLPEKEEVVVWVELTGEQQEFYKAIYSKQVGALLGGGAKSDMPGMRNLAMELRKLCCHPFLCDGLEEESRMRRVIKQTEAGGSATVNELELLVRASGKMVLLNKLLPKLRKEGRRVLIFSQFTRVLDLLEDYFAMMAWPHERIDGNTKGKDRQVRIDRFTNGSDEECFIFLLSTRAGGQGITLTAADTAILYDSDWNPQNDLQAMARCHRIGQSKEVTIYRLITKATYEEHLFNTASRKYGLDEAILGGPDAGSGGDPEADAERLAVLLAQGAHALLLAPAAPQGEGAEAAGSKDTAFQQEDIDTILQGRTEKRQLGSRAGNTFSVARFAAVEEEEPVAAPKGREYWAELLPEAVAAHDEREMAKMRGPLVDGPRQRKQVDYRINGRAQRTTQESSSDSEGGTRRKGGGAAKKGAKRAGSHDDDYQADADEAQPGDGEAGLPKNPKKGRKSGAAAEGPPPPKKWTARE
ncbi:hypothetical protein QJQ45_024466, partial [Haematococcus lacustris]